MTIFDDPNREAVGLIPIWEVPEPPPEGATAKATAKATEPDDDEAGSDE